MRGISLPARAMKLLLIFIGAVVIGYAALVAVYALPVDAINNHISESMVTFDGSDGAGEERNENLARSYAQTWLDNTSDSCMLLLASYPSEEPAYISALRNDYYTTGVSPYVTLRAIGGGNTDGADTTSYQRYWHGYLVLLKPLLLICTYMDIRIINMLVQGGLLLLLFMGMAKRGLKGFIPALAAALALLTPWIIPLCMHYSTVFIITLIAMNALLYGCERIQKSIGITGFFMLIGIAASYFDLMSYPLVSFGLPFLVSVLLEPNKSLRWLLKALCATGLAWLLGYFGMWVAKFCLAEWIGGIPTWENALDAIALRSSDEGISRIDAIIRNLRCFNRKPYKLMLIASACVVLAARLRRGKAPSRLCLSRLVIYLAIAVLPIAWYAVLGNHSHIHYFFTHRLLAITALSLLLAASEWVLPAETDIPQHTAQTNMHKEAT